MWKVGSSFYIRDELLTNEEKSRMGIENSRGKAFSVRYIETLEKQGQLLYFRTDNGCKAVIPSRMCSPAEGKARVRIIGPADSTASLERDVNAFLAGVLIDGVKILSLQVSGDAFLTATILYEQP